MTLQPGYGEIVHVEVAAFLDSSVSAGLHKDEFPKKLTMTIWEKRPDEVVGKREIACTQCTIGKHRTVFLPIDQKEEIVMKVSVGETFKDHHGSLWQPNDVEYARYEFVTSAAVKKMLAPVLFYGEHRILHEGCGSHPFCDKRVRVLIMERCQALRNSLECNSHTRPNLRDILQEIANMHGALHEHDLCFEDGHVDSFAVNSSGQVVITGYHRLQKESRSDWSVWTFLKDFCKIRPRHHDDHDAPDLGVMREPCALTKDIDEKYRNHFYYCKKPPIEFLQFLLHYGTESSAEHLPLKASDWECDAAGIWLYWSGDASAIDLRGGIVPQSINGKSYILFTSSLADCLPGHAIYKLKLAWEFITRPFGEDPNYRGRKCNFMFDDTEAWLTTAKPLYSKQCLELLPHTRSNIWTDLCTGSMHAEQCQLVSYYDVVLLGGTGGS